ncbi:hypothetical protein BU14_0068s0031 [Porphyra umbilicalis]|uniref:Uncharacterized protein n=1 Tax=Porphyra umbilicalis TaxID=2786 RepID=A0A1X6PGQ8_PORUM|nr:hypothetical protein BU14_0068s0031 [Porphyra umbilicalis]|eukprot:OSX79936.1 hypothetical protein BU14_0068s0031 [Porphyra umbilicalis]
MRWCVVNDVAFKGVTPTTRKQPSDGINKRQQAPDPPPLMTSHPNPPSCPSCSRPVFPAQITNLLLIGIAHCRVLTGKPYSAGDCTATIAW